MIPYYVAAFSAWQWRISGIRSDELLKGVLEAFLQIHCMTALWRNCSYTDKSRSVTSGIANEPIGAWIGEFMLTCGSEPFEVFFMDDILLFNSRRFIHTLKYVV